LSFIHVTECGFAFNKDICKGWQNGSSGRALSEYEALSSNSTTVKKKMCLMFGKITPVSCLLADFRKEIS
jgi:hypothetical protein